MVIKLVQVYFKATELGLQPKWFSLSLCIRNFPQMGICKQCRSRSDAAKRGVESGSTLFAINFRLKWLKKGIQTPEKGDFSRVAFIFLHEYETLSSKRGWGFVNARVLSGSAGDLTIPTDMSKTFSTTIVRVIRIRHSRPR